MTQRIWLSKNEIYYLQHGKLPKGVREEEKHFKRDLWNKIKKAQKVIDTFVGTVKLIDKAVSEGRFKPQTTENKRIMKQFKEKILTERLQEKISPAEIIYRKLPELDKLSSYFQQKYEELQENKAWRILDYMRKHQQLHLYSEARKTAERLVKEEEEKVIKEGNKKLSEAEKDELIDRWIFLLSYSPESMKITAKERGTLRTLRREFTVGEIASAVKLSQPMTRHYLNVLIKRGKVKKIEARREAFVLAEFYPS